VAEGGITRKEKVLGLENRKEMRKRNKKGREECKISCTR
jgi:hypothetical protein